MDEGSGLENQRRGNPTVGSNPTSSANVALGMATCVAPKTPQREEDVLRWVRLRQPEGMLQEHSCASAGLDPVVRRSE